MHLPETAASARFALRMLSAMSGQRRRTPRCPDDPRLDAKLALVTGATGGIGLEIAHGLAARGAELILPCRSPEKGEAVRDALRARHAAAAIHLTRLDLEDLSAIRSAVDHVERFARGRTLDLLVENAGIWPQRYATTPQGHEIAFGVNVLSHFALRRQLQERGLLARDARVVILTGDIYILESTCTPDSTWKGAIGGMRAYCRSKLGNVWIASELLRRHPTLEVRVAHPGVVATSLGGDAGAAGNWLKRRAMLSPEEGAQMPLVCATQPDLENGAYYHNTRGLMRLSERDPARNTAAAAKLWETCEALTAPPA